MFKLKEPLDYTSQIKRLKEFHKLTINDDSEALEILQAINYYRLSGYGIGLTKSNNRDEYQEGVTLKDLYDLHTFDRILKSCLFNVIELIEIDLRTKIAYCLAIKYGAGGYYDPKNFDDKCDKNGKSIYKWIIKNFTEEINRNKDLPFVKHHLNHYEGCFPIWVAVELFSFGNLSSLYSIMKSRDKKDIAKQYNCSPKYLGVWIQSLVEVRNICAHYGRLYNLPLRHRPPLPSEFNTYYTVQNKLFPVIVVLKLLLHSNKYRDDFFKFLKRLFQTYQHVIKLDYIGFPTDWENILSIP